jgi:hypothetical protein
MEGQCWDETFLYVADAEEAAVDESRWTDYAVVDIAAGQDWTRDNGITKGIVGKRALGDGGVWPDLRIGVRRCERNLRANFRRHDVEADGWLSRIGGFDIDWKGNVVANSVWRGVRVRDGETLEHLMHANFGSRIYNWAKFVKIMRAN